MRPVVGVEGGPGRQIGDGERQRVAVGIGRRWAGSCTPALRRQCWPAVPGSSAPRLRRPLRAPTLCHRHRRHHHRILPAATQHDTCARRRKSWPSVIHGMSNCVQSRCTQGAVARRPRIRASEAIRGHHRLCDWAEPLHRAVRRRGYATISRRDPHMNSRANVIDLQRRECRVAKSPTV